MIVYTDNDIKNFIISRVGCSSLGMVLDNRDGTIGVYCSFLANNNCEDTECLIKNCPKVNEEIYIKQGEPKYKAFFDGGAKPNPGTITIGGYIKDDKGGIISSYSQWQGQGTSNQAEYLSLLHLCKLLIEASIKNVKIYGDSQLVVNQINGEWKVKDTILKDYWNEIHECLKRIPKWELSHVPREENQEADNLT